MVAEVLPCRIGGCDDDFGFVISLCDAVSDDIDGARESDAADPDLIDAISAERKRGESVLRCGVHLPQQ